MPPRRAHPSIQQGACRVPIMLPETLERHRDHVRIGWPKTEYFVYTTFKDTNVRHSMRTFAPFLSKARRHELDGRTGDRCHCANQTSECPGSRVVRRRH